ncbi:hypothetical protein J6590_052980 [Homalodisca vitripennis]|nr:hypothetical protein J6590_052980 [Homalodisca vitripennis]
MLRATAICTSRAAVAGVVLRCYVTKATTLLHIRLSEATTPRCQVREVARQVRGVTTVTYLWFKLRVHKPFSPGAAFRIISTGRRRGCRRHLAPTHLKDSYFHPCGAETRPARPASGDGVRPDGVGIA